MHKIKFLRGGKMKIVVNELKTEAIIGCYDYERNQKQPLVINLELELGNWNYPDELIHTVSYDELCQIIRELTQASKFLLLESLAHYLVNQLFTRYSQIKHISINISKPDVCDALDCLIQVEYAQNRQYKIALALGSNLNNPQHQLISAIEFLSEIVSEIKVAPFYKSSPQGFSEQDDFYNTCISGVTTLEPQELLIALKKIEKCMGK
jgi:dihydroneopterin aldolase